MDTIEVIWLALMLVMLLLSAFFSGSEAAFLSLQRGKLAVMIKNKVRGAESVAQMVGRPEKLLPTVLTGNNLTNTAAAALGTSLIATRLGPSESVIVSTVVITVLLLIFSETIPKTVAARNSERFALLAVRPLQWVGIMLLPPVWVLERLARLVARLFGVSGANMFAGEEIRALIVMGREAGEVEAPQADMLEQVFRFFGERQLREVMTPRTEIVALEKGASLQDFLDVYSLHSHTRFPIFENNLDNVIGTVSVKDVVRAMSTDKIPLDYDITGLVRDAYFVPETKMVGSVFPELRESSYQMIMVADEFGGVAGLVTLKQLVEEVVGRVGEEGAAPEEEFQAIDANTYQVEGGMDINEANDRMGIDIPDGDYETVAGFILSRLGHIPRESERLLHKGFILEITEMRGVRIEQVKATRVATVEGST